MSGIVAARSFVYTSGGVDTFYRQDVTVVDTATDAAYAADHFYFIPSAGAKTANVSFVYPDANGVDRFYRKNITKVAATDAAYVAVPSLFT